MPKCPVCFEEKIKRCNACHHAFGVGDTAICYDHHNGQRYHFCDADCLYDWFAEDGDVVPVELVKDF